MLKMFQSPQAGAHVVATIVVTGFVALIIVLATRVVAESTLMVTMAGIIGSKFSSVVDFYLGSSAGSAQKTAQISQLIGQGGSTPPAGTPPQAGS